jgi:hypothetical protein
MMNEIELQSIINGLAAVTGKMRVTRGRLAAGASDPASPAQQARLTAALSEASAEISLLLGYFAAGLADTPAGQVLADMEAIERDAEGYTSTD